MNGIGARAGSMIKKTKQSKTAKQVVHVVDWTRTDAKCQTTKKARANRANLKYRFSMLHMQLCDCRSNAGFEPEEHHEKLYGRLQGFEIRSSTFSIFGYCVVL